MMRIKKSGRPLEDRQGVAQGRVEDEDSLAPSPGQGASQAFTRCDLLVVLGTLALLGTLVVPALANNRARSDLAVCQSNLRQIGQAFRVWADDHGGNYAYRISGAEGGNNHIPLCNQVWFQYYWLSNEIRTPKILVCPSDKEKRPALDWSASPETGFNHTTFRDNACSYLLTIGIRQSPHGLLSGDRNIVPATRNTGGCAAGTLYGGVATLMDEAPTLDWTTGLHNRTGNIVLNDGSVLTAGREDLKATIRSAQRPGAHLCTLYPLPIPFP